MSFAPQVLGHDENRCLNLKETVALLRSRLKDGLATIGLADDLGDEKSILESTFYEDENVILDLAENIER